MKNYKYLFLLFISFLITSIHGQDFNLQDTLRGSITPERAWWDLTYYQLDIEVDPDEQYISGTNTIQYKVLKPAQRMQVDLQPPLEITEVRQSGKKLKFVKLGNAHYIDIPKVELGGVYEVVVSYKGFPKSSRRPPWDGGFTWRKDSNGKHFAATSCQGDGASLWWPCKDHMYDEVDSMLISVTIPDDLMDVSNGVLRNTEVRNRGTKTWHWFVNNPINNYGVNVNIGDYVHFGETYSGEAGPLKLDYYVLPENLEKAKEQFKQTPMMMDAFEHWFGPYPFYEDGFKLVEVPYLGMEHQSSVTYGNQYLNGYLGTDRSDSGWGMEFDFIIIHEAGHEWFANNLTNVDIADMWVHEGFTAYSEALYLEYHYGKHAGDAYNIGKRWRIRNDRPIIGPYDVNQSGSSDMYVKGANLLHTLRQLAKDTEQWRSCLRGLNKEFYHQTVTSKQVEDYMAETMGLDLDAFFDQYLRDTRIPILEYRLLNETLWYRWHNCIPFFDMKVKVNINGKDHWLAPTTTWDSKKMDEHLRYLEVDRNFLVAKMEHKVFN